MNYIPQYLFFGFILIFVLLILFSKRFKEIFYRPHPNNLSQLSKEQFYSQFENLWDGLSGEQKLTRWKEIIDKAWSIRDFEIDLYWRRANYFWLFQVPAFTGYFWLVRSNVEGKMPYELFALSCLGVIFSTGWFLINKGSKSWQRHWEEYIDLLEGKYYGPIYKTVSNHHTFSVTKINEIVSASFVFVWCLFGLSFLVKGDYFNFNFDIKRLDVFIAFPFLFTLLILCAMFFGYGRGLFKRRDIKMYSRDFRYIDPGTPKQNL